MQSPGAPGELFALVYEQLRAIAQHKLNQERTGHSLLATDLVNEAYLRLVKAGVIWSSLGAFYHAAAEAMERILIDHARARAAIKRGGDGQGRPPRRLPLGVLDLAAEADPEEITMLVEAIRRLEEEDPEVAQVVRLRFYTGASGDETARALGRSPSSVDRDWAYARARLYRELRDA